VEGKNETLEKESSGSFRYFHSHHLGGRILYIQRGSHHSHLIDRFGGNAVHQVQEMEKSPERNYDHEQ
jgi:hypothetical protein